MFFKSGTTATELICDYEINWYGLDVSNNKFTPQPSKNYYIEFFKNVDMMNAIVRVNYVDDVISDTSTNPVQNKVIKEYIDSIVGTIETELGEI